jgi:hypothetical protein
MRILIAVKSVNVTGLYFVNTPVTLVFHKKKGYLLALLIVTDSWLLEDW